MPPEMSRWVNEMQHIFRILRLLKLREDVLADVVSSSEATERSAHHHDISSFRHYRLLLVFSLFSRGLCWQSSDEDNRLMATAGVVQFLVSLAAASPLCEPVLLSICLLMAEAPELLNEKKESRSILCTALEAQTEVV